MRVAAAAETGIARRRGERGCAPVSTFSGHRADGRQIDLSAQFIELIETRGIAYVVMRFGPARALRTLNAVG